MAGHTLAFNLLLTGALLDGYVDLNLPLAVAVTSHPLYLRTADALFILLIGSMTFFQAGVFRAFQGEVLSPSLRRWLKILFAGAGAGLILGMATADVAPSLSRIIQESTGDLLFLGEFLLLFFILFSGRRQPDPRRKKEATVYAGVYLGRYPLILFLLLTPEFLRFFASMTVLFTFNLIPFLWRIIVGRPANRPRMTHPDNMTAREREVIELVLSGKSNREIENLLCISPHTVKNHLYNIYRKLKVRNRYGLIASYR